MTEVTQLETSAQVINEYIAIRMANDFTEFDTSIKVSRKFLLQLHTANKKTNKLEWITISLIVNIERGETGQVYIDFQYNSDFRKLGKFASQTYAAYSTHSSIKETITKSLAYMLPSLSREFDSDTKIYLETTMWK